MLSRKYGQAERAIRTSKLNTLLCLHPWPMYVVVFDGPSEELPEGSSSGASLGDLILGHASRLDAFSGYHCRTSLPSRAPGGTTGTQAVRPSRSSRTRDSSPQISYAHTR